MSRTAAWDYARRFSRLRGFGVSALHRWLVAGLAAGEWPDGTATDDNLTECWDRNELITIHYPDNSQHAFLGYLKTLVPGGMVDGEMTCQVTITPVVRKGSFRMDVQ